MAGPKTRFYVDKRHKKVSGVCAGLSEYFGWDVTWVRVGAVGALSIAGPMILIGYFVAAKAAPDRPAGVDEIERRDPEEKEFWRKVRKNPRGTARAVRARFRDIDRRLAHAEAYLTSPDKRLAREIERLR
jgi:phage shock protein C